MSKPRPDLVQLARLADEIVRALAAKGVMRVEHVVAFSPPFDYWLWLGTSTDDERDRLMRDRSIVGLLRDLTQRHGPKATFEGFTVESQETVDRDYEGSWFYRLR